MTNFTATILRNSVFGITAQILIKVLSFAFSVLIIRQLGAEAFGQYSAVVAFGFMFAFISDLGLSPYAVRQIARLRDQPDGVVQAQILYGNVIRLRLFLSIFTILLLVGTAWLTGRPVYLIGAIFFNSLGLILYAIQGASDALLSGFERLDITSSAKVLNQFTFVVIGSIVLYLGFGYYGLIIANLIGIIVMAYSCWNGGKSLGLKPLWHMDLNWPKLLRASLPFGIIGFALGLSYKFDTVLLTIFRGDSETGFYNCAYNLVFSAIVFSNAINTTLYPSLTRQAILEPEGLPRIYERTLRYLMMISLPIAVGVWALAEQFVIFLYSQKYIQAVPALQIIIWVVPLMFASEFLGYVVVIANKERKVAQSILISTSINVLLNLFLVPRFGFIAASVMTVITEAILVAQYVWMLRKLIMNINIMRCFILPFLSALIMGGLLILIRERINIFFCILIGIVIYFSALSLFRIITFDDFRFLQTVRPHKTPL